MLSHYYKSRSLALFMLLLGPCWAFTQDYSEDITDASTGIIEAISEHPGSIPNLAAYAFDNDTTIRGWANSMPTDFPAWISYEFPETEGPKKVVAYRLYCSNQQSNFWPSSFIPVAWTLEGENNDGLFLLDSVVTAGINTNEWKQFEITNEQYFDKYIFTFYRTQGNQPFTFVTEMELYEPAEIVNTTQLDAEALVDIYPNPVSEILTIRTKNSELLSITVFNDLGQKITNINDVHALDNVQLDCSQYHKGVYTILFQSQNGWSTKRIVIE